MAASWFVGCSISQVPSQYADQFLGVGTHLQRYASRFNANEINSSFRQAHQFKTYERWAASVPENFRFSVKMHRHITHELGLQNAAAAVEEFLEQIAGLGNKLGPILVQFPPSFRFHSAQAGSFFEHLRRHYRGLCVCEPRHWSWFKPNVDALLASYEIARAAADPVEVEQGMTPGGWSGLAYYRLHGSPRMYYSAYSESVIASVATAVKGSIKHGVPTWCIFDNAAENAATYNGLQLIDMLTGRWPVSPPNANADLN